MFPVDLLRRRDRRLGAPAETAPILLIRRENQRQVVAWRCGRAADAGVVPGMPLSDAEGLLGSPARTEHETPQRDRAALRALAAWAQRFSPVAAPDPPDGLLLDVSGCERVFGGEDRLLARVLADLDRLGFPARAVIAPTFGCAWAVARYGRERAAIIPENGARSAIAPLPVRALRIDAAAAEGLLEVGIERAGHLLALGRSVLPARFGAELLLRLDQALGEALETIEPVRPLAPASAERVFDGPTTQTEAIERCVRELIGVLCGELARRGSGAREILVRLRRSDLPPASLRLVLSRPARDAAHLWSLVRPRLERVNLGFGVEEVAVEAPRLGRLPHQQAERWLEGGTEPDRASERAAAALLDTLTNRLGDDRVRRAETIESHLPERVFRMRSVTEDRSAHPATVVTGDRPHHLTDRPSAAEVIALTPDGPVHAVRWRDTEQSVLSSIGPERISPEWWRRGGPAGERDYFKVQTADGRWLWIYRETHSRSWFVHGVWT